MDDLVLRDGLYYKKFTEVPFTGEVTGKEQGSLKNGKKEGSWISYYDNGQLKSKGDWYDGEKDGNWIGYSESGNVCYRGGYWNYGKKDGYWETYFACTTMIDRNLTGTYKNGIKVSDHP
jgi:antitoxin component YwqK of YwqJK toxin-antitoxin module